MELSAAPIEVSETTDTFALKYTVVYGSKCNVALYTFFRGMTSIWKMYGPCHFSR